jgi:NADPH:quinone reductase-like Zn-dependent oxidoreductase
MALAELPLPTPGPGQVLVRIEASVVNEMDVQVRDGGWPRQVKRFLRAGSVVTGFEFAGTVQSCGRRLRPGDRVAGYVHVLNGPRVHAEFACVAEADMARIPDDVPSADAAALVVMGLTAIEIVERLARRRPGRTALVIGAGGGVGVYALQLARHYGARVTAVCGEASADWIREQGAAEVRPREQGSPWRPGDAFDLVVDAPAASSFAEARPRMATGGLYVSTNPFADLWGFGLAALSRRRAGYLMMLTTDPHRLGRLFELHRQGALAPVIDSRFDLSQADAAFDRFAARGKRGRVILEMPQS